MYIGDSIKCYSCKSHIIAACANEVIGTSDGITTVDCDNASKPHSGQFMPVTQCEKAITRGKQFNFDLAKNLH